MLYFIVCGFEILNNGCYVVVFKIFIYFGNKGCCHFIAGDLYFGIFRKKRNFRYHQGNVFGKNTVRIFEILDFDLLFYFVYVASKIAERMPDLTLILTLIFIFFWLIMQNLLFKKEMEFLLKKGALERK